MWVVKFYCIRLPNEWNYCCLETNIGNRGAISNHVDVSENIVTNSPRNLSNIFWLSLSITVTVEKIQWKIALLSSFISLFKLLTTDISEYSNISANAFHRLNKYLLSAILLDYNYSVPSKTPLNILLSSTL